MNWGLSWKHKDQCILFTPCVNPPSPVCASLVCRYTFLQHCFAYFPPFCFFFFSKLTISFLHQDATKESLVLALKAMKQHFDLWQRYFDDFLIQKLRLGGIRGEAISQQILRVFFEQLHEHEAVSRVVLLHCYFHTNQLDLAKMANLLRPLNQIEQVGRWEEKKIW